MSMFQSAKAQNVVFSLCHLGSTGMWNALNTMGSFGTGSEDLGHVMNMIAAIVGAVAGLFSGSALNLLGVRVGCFIALLAGAVQIFSSHMYWFLEWIPMWAVGLLTALGGAGLPMFFSAAGACLMKYALDEERPAFITVNSIMVNIGGLGGAVMALAFNWNVEGDNAELSRVSHLILTLIPFVPVLLCAFLREPDKVRRSDGTLVEKSENTLKEELRGMKDGLTDVYLWLIALYAFAQMWHEVWLYNWINMEAFDVRGRCFNALIYYIGRVFWALVYKFVVSRPGSFAQKAYAGFGVNAFIYLAATICILFRVFNWVDIGDMSGADFTYGRSWVLTAAFFFYGGIETINFNHSNWVIGCLPMDMAGASRYSGWLRTLNSLGMGLPWALDIGHAVPYWIQWLVHTVGTISSFGLVWVLVERMKKVLGNNATKPVYLDEELGSHLELGSHFELGSHLDLGSHLETAPSIGPEGKHSPAAWK